MATNALSALTVLLGLDASQYERGLDKAERQAQQFARNTRAAILEVGKVLGGLEISRIVLETTKAILSEASALSDLASATGSSVESLSRLTNQAKISGSDLATVETALLKLSKGMAGTDAESTKTKDALKLLGVTTRDPVEALEQASVKLETFRDGVNKVGLAAALFGGKDGQVFLKVMQDIAKQQDVVSTTTTKQAEEAKRLSTEWNRLSVEATTFKNAILSMASPLADVIAQLIEAQRATGGFFSALKLFSDTRFAFGETTQHLRDLNQELANLEATKKQGGLGEQINAALGLGADKKIEEVKQKIRVFEFILKQEQEAQRSFRKAPGEDKPEAPFIPNDNIAKQILARQLKDLDAFIQSERDLLGDREKFLQIYYQDDQIGLRGFFAGRRAALEEAVAQEAGALDKQAALLRDFARKAKPEDRIDAETKLADVLAKKAKLEQDAASKGIVLILEEGRAVKQFKESVEQAAIALAEMRGDTVTAAAAGFDFANKKLQAQINELKSSPRAEDKRLGEIGDKTLADTRALVVLRSQLNKATQEYSLTLDELGIAQERISIAQETGLISGVEASERRIAASREYVSLLKQELVEVERLSAASGKREDLVMAAQLRVRIEREAANAIIEERKAWVDFANTVSDAGASAFEGFINGTRTAKDAFRAFVSDIQSQLVRLALKNVINKILGVDTGGPDAFSLFAKFLGSFGSGGTGASSIPGSFTGPALGTAASGTDFARGGLTLVGERGPEIVNLPRGARVTPNSKLGGVTIHQTVNVMPGATTQSARQAGNLLRDVTMRAIRDR